MKNGNDKKYVKVDLSKTQKKMTISDVNREVEKLRAAGEHTMSYGKYVDKYGV